MDYYHISAQELGKGAKLPILKLGLSLIHISEPTRP